MIYLFPFGGLVSIKNLSHHFFADNIQLCSSFREWVGWVFGSHHPVYHQTSLRVVPVSVSAAPQKKSGQKRFCFFINLS